MFQKVIGQLKKGEVPEKENLRNMLQIALVKKMGVLRMPYLCRSEDPKINPPADQLLAVAALLRDEENILLAADILLIEISEKGDGGRGGIDSPAARRYIESVFLCLAHLPEEAALLRKLLQKFK